MGKTYTSARGKVVDMEKLAMKHESTLAVGNIRTNARGDELGPGGKILRTREQVLEEYYAEHPEAQREYTANRKK